MNPQHGQASIFGGLRKAHLEHFFGNASSLLRLAAIRS
jgi:hypothetical protein